MNLRSRYGYLILALKQYPFDKEIKDRIEEIEVPWKPSDPNTGIKSNKTVTHQERVRSRIASTRIDERSHFFSQGFNSRK